MINIDSDKIEYESYARTVKDYRESLKKLEQSLIGLHILRNLWKAPLPDWTAHKDGN